MEKKEKKIPFDIKYRPQIESGEYKVETREGKPARIVCWDRFATEDCENIVALVTSNKNESAYYYYQDGHLWNKANDEGDSSLDLFIITPESELTGFEQMLYSIFDAYNGLKINVRAAVETNAKTILELAKKEICKGCTVGLDQYWKGYEEAMKAKKHYTFQCPTYEPPCFHGGVCTNPMKDCINCPNHSSENTINTTSGTYKKD